MRKFFMLFIAILFAGLVLAQDEETKIWEIKGETGITYSNAYFGDYWAAGGDNSNSLLWRGIVSANRTGEKGTWENTLDLSYGLIKQGDLDLRKMNDKIDFLSKYSIDGFSEKWRYMALFNLKSQFTEGFKYENNKILVSDFLAPAFITASVGIEYMGSDKLKIFISPFSQKTTIVKTAYYDKKVENKAIDNLYPDGVDNLHEGEEIIIDPQDLEAAESELESTITYGLEWRDNIRTELGALAQIIYDHPDLVKGFGFKTRLDLFAAYSHIDKVDIDWEFWLTFKFNQFLSMNINTQMIYDDDVRFEVSPGRYSPKLQLRNLFGVGLVYTFSN